MPDLPEEAVQAATEALEARAAHVPYFTHRIMARIVLETGGPVLAAQVRRDLLAAAPLVLLVRRDSREEP